MYTLEVLLSRTAACDMVRADVIFSLKGDMDSRPSTPAMGMSVLKICDNAAAETNVCIMRCLNHGDIKPVSAAGTCWQVALHEP